VKGEKRERHRKEGEKEGVGRKRRKEKKKKERKEREKGGKEGEKGGRERRERRRERRERKEGRRYESIIPFDLFERTDVNIANSTNRMTIRHLRCRCPRLDEEEEKHEGGKESNRRERVEGKSERR